VGYKAIKSGDLGKEMRLKMGVEVGDISMELLWLMCGSSK
jgi:hypothetical protein